MGMLAQIAWRNIGRHRLRSAAVIGAVVLGLWAVVFSAAFYWGMSEQRVRTAIRNEISHIQLHHPQYPEDRKAVHAVEDAREVAERLRSRPGVRAVSPRILAQGMAATARRGDGVLIRGIRPQIEDAATGLQERIVEGAYFSGDLRHPLVIGEELAESLGAGVRSKVVLTFQDVQGNMVAAAFRVAGIFRSGNAPFDRRNVYVRAGELDSLMGLRGGAHEIAVLLEDDERTAALADKLEAAFPHLLVRTWRQVAPELDFLISSFEQTMAIFMAIIMLGLLFGIVNTMLMAILERTREIGMLMALGLNRPKLFGMVLLETLFLSLLGAPVGLLLAWLTVVLAGRTGIDLSIVSEGLESYGLGRVVHPRIGAGFYLQAALMVAITAMVAALYPCYRALKLNPAESIRKI